MENVFYFFYKIIDFWLNKKKDDIQSVHTCIVLFFRETVNSHNLETANHTALIIFVLHIKQIVL